MSEILITTVMDFDSEAGANRLAEVRQESATGKLFVRCYVNGQVVSTAMDDLWTEDDASNYAEDFCLAKETTT